MLAILFALGSNISFAAASILFTDFSRKVSPNWVNYLKVAVAFVCFCLVIAIFRIDINLASRSFWLLIISGFVGLMIGDIFLFRAFAHLGPGRVLMIFGFQPLLLSAASYYLFDERFAMFQLIAIIFLMLCIFCFSMESFLTKGHWDIAGICFALVGVLLDAAGLLMTKEAFRITPDLSPFVANAIRAGIALLGFFFVSFVPIFAATGILLGMHSGSVSVVPYTKSFVPSLFTLNVIILGALLPAAMLLRHSTKNTL